jgi:hypothetical protein
MSSRRMIASIAGAVLVLGSAVVLLWNAASTSSARLADTTATETFFAAGRVQLDQPNDRIEFLFDDLGLFPGRPVAGCVELVYRGDIPATIRLHGSSQEDAGLDEYLEIELRIAESCTDEPDAATAFAGPLPSLWAAHGTFADGLPLASDARTDQRLAVHATIEVRDDNAAQGLTSAFTLIAEARP